VGKVTVYQYTVLDANRVERRKAEKMQEAIVQGHPVDADQLIRVSSTSQLVSIAPRSAKPRHDRWSRTNRRPGAIDKDCVRAIMLGHQPDSSSNFPAHLSFNRRGSSYLINERVRLACTNRLDPQRAAAPSHRWDSK
jgi:hypothetical protein